MKKETLVDVMSRGYYVCSIKVPLGEDGTIDLKSLLQIVYKKRPTLRYEKDLVFYLNKAS